MDVRRVDVAVIGAGTAGLEAWRAARDAGADAVLIEAGAWGTTCIRVGCIPSKLLLAAADAARNAREAEVFGVRPAPVEVDGRAVMARVRAERDHFLEAALRKAEDIPAAARLQGRARFLSATRLAVEGGPEVEATAVVIATGSRPQVAPQLELAERLLTTDSVFELEELPASLAVAGAGSVGVELALAFARLRVKTTVFDKSPTPAGLQDPQVGARAAELFRREVELHLECELEATPEGESARVRWRSKAGGGEQVFARVLSASGRTPNVEGLGLQATGLALRDDGVPEHDPLSGRCGESRVFIAGDAAQDRPVLHEAAFGGRQAGGNAARGEAAAQPTRPPFAISYTDPDCAVVGEPLKALGGEAVCAVFDEGRGRARIEGRPNPLIKLWMRKAGGPVAGGEMVGPGVEAMSQLLVQLIAARTPLRDALQLPFYHPTYAEDLKGALEALDAAWRES